MRVCYNVFIRNDFKGSVLLNITTEHVSPLLVLQKGLGRTNRIDLRVGKNITQSEPEIQILTLASA